MTNFRRFLLRAKLGKVFAATSFAKGREMLRATITQFSGKSWRRRGTKLRQKAEGSGFIKGTLKVAP